MTSYRQDANTLLDGFRLLHKVGDPGHDGGAVVAGPVTEEALHLLKIFLVKTYNVRYDSIATVGEIRVW